MALQVQTLTRVFTYNGAELADPGQNMALDDVKNFYSAIYPELVNATIDGPEQKGEKAVYSFVRTAGAKG